MTLIVVESPQPGLLGYEFYRVAVLALLSIRASGTRLVGDEEQLRIGVESCMEYAEAIRELLEYVVEENLFFTGNDYRNTISKIAKWVNMDISKRVSAKTIVKAYADFVEVNCSEEKLRDVPHNLAYPSLFKVNFYELKRDFKSKPSSEARGDLHQIVLMMLGALLAKTGIVRVGDRRLAYYTLTPPVGPDILLDVDAAGKLREHLVVSRNIIRKYLDVPERIRYLALLVETAHRLIEEKQFYWVMQIIYQAVVSEQGNRASLIEYEPIILSQALLVLKDMNTKDLNLISRILGLYAKLYAKRDDQETRGILTGLGEFLENLILYLETTNPTYMYNAVRGVEALLSAKRDRLIRVIGEEAYNVLVKASTRIPQLAIILGT